MHLKAQQYKPSYNKTKIRENRVFSLILSGDDDAGATRGGQQVTTVGTSVVESRLARGGEWASPPCCRAPESQGQTRDIFPICPFFSELRPKLLFFSR